MKSSKRGTNSAVRGIRPEFDSLESGGSIEENSLTTTSGKAIDTKSATIPMETLQQTGYIYGWKPDHALAQMSFRPHETWLIYQAKSILRKDVTLEEAVEFFKTTDITTRKPREITSERRPSGFWAALRAIFRTTGDGNERKAES